MYKIVTIFIFLLIISSYIVYKQKKNDKYNNSPINLLIERAYSIWYSNSGRIINKKYSTVFEFDKVQLELKEDLVSKGITIEDIKKYLEFLKNGTGIYFTSRDWLVTLISGIGSLGVTSIFKELFPEFQLPTMDKIVELFSDKEVVTNVKLGFLLVLSIAIIIMFLWVMIKISKIDVIYKDKQRVFLLERLIEIWSFGVNEEVGTLEEILELEKTKDRRNTVYKKMAFTQTKLEKLQVEALGETLRDNFLFISEILKISLLRSKIKQCLKFILSYTVSFLLVAVIVCLELSVRQLNIFFYVAYIILVMLLCILWIPFYFSQMDMYTDDLTALKTIWSVRGFNLVLLKRGWLASCIPIVYTIPFIFHWFISRENFAIVSFGVVTLIGILSLFCRIERYNENPQIDN